MMARKLAGFFAIMGIIVYFASWLYRSWRPGGPPGMSSDDAWVVGICMAGAFFTLGLFVASLGIGLMQEVLAERRSKDIERKFRAKSLYDSVVHPTPDENEAQF